MSKNPSIQETDIYFRLPAEAIQALSKTRDRHGGWTWVDRQWIKSDREDAPFMPYDPTAIVECIYGRAVRSAERPNSIGIAFEGGYYVAYISVTDRPTVSVVGVSMRDAALRLLNSVWPLEFKRMGTPKLGDSDRKTLKDR